MDKDLHKEPILPHQETYQAQVHMRAIPKHSRNHLDRCLDQRREESKKLTETQVQELTHYHQR